MILLHKDTRKNKKGEIVDASIKLILFDKHNFAIVKGEPGEKGYNTSSIIGFFGDFRTALKKSLDIVIKQAGDPLEISKILQRINELDERINKLESLSPQEYFIQGE